MKSIGILGPKGTFTEIAARKFQDDLNFTTELFYYDTIDHVFSHFNDHDYLVLPFENTIDGYVQRTLDLLLTYKGFIIKTYDVEVNFSYIYNSSHPKHLFSQFKAYNQCLNFLSNKIYTSIHKTANNVESLNLFIQTSESAAIIPTHLLDPSIPHIKNIGDQNDNHTRFIVIQKEKASLEYSKHAYVVILNQNDKPGILQNILNVFYHKNINLTSIMSRPTRRFIGSYHFFIELEINGELDKLYEVISSLDNVTLLGIY